MMYWMKYAVSGFMGFWVFQFLIKAACVYWLSQSEEPIAQLYFGRQNAEVLVVGNSRALRLFSDSAFKDNLGMSSANLSVQSGSTKISLTILNDYLERHSKPKVIIHEITDLIRKDGAVQTLRVYAGASPRLRAIQCQVESKWAIGGKILPTLDFNSQEFREWAAQVVRGKPSYLLETEMSSEIGEGVSQMGFAQYNSTKDNLDALTEIKDLCEKLGIQYIPVVAPLFPSYLEKISNFDEWINKAKMELGDDCPVADYSSHKALAKPELYADHTHINRRGVKVFFELIRKDVRLGQ